MSTSLHEALKVPAGADARQVDAAYRAAGAPASLRFAWKVLRDPFYAAAWARYQDPEVLEQAGFFDDGVDVGTVSYPDERLDLLCTPVHKLQAQLAAHEQLAPDSRPVVLLSTGAFSPVHDGHLEMLHAARAELERRQVTVVGGYLAPDHDHYVGGKYGGSAALDAAHRIALCDAAVTDSDWLMVDPWAAVHVGTALNYTDVLGRLEAYLHAHVDPRLAVYAVFGADNAGFARAFIERGGCVCLPREGRDVAELAQDPALAGREQIVFAQDAGAAASASSSAVRAGDHAHLPAAVRDRCAKWKLRWEDAASRPTVAHERPAVYALRDDAGWATRVWRCDRPELPAAVDEFRSGVIELVQDSFQRVSWPDQPRDVRVVLLDHDVQQQFVRRLAARRPVINLDVCTDGGFPVGFSRMFGLSDGQYAATGMTARPGSPALEEQLERLPAGEFILLDDDIATGYTMARVTEQLPGRVKVNGSVSLLRDAPGPLNGLPVLDVVDLRDLLLGAQDAGLVVRLPDGQIARAPYLLPYVNPVSRAKLPPSSQQRFALELWELNRRFFEQADTPLTVADADRATARLLRYVGFAENTALEDVCAWHLRRLRELPFQRAA